MSSKDKALKDCVDSTFEEKDEFSDLTLIVEGKKLHVHKAILALNSPVFKRTFLSDFKKKNAAEEEFPERKRRKPDAIPTLTTTEIELPGKRYEIFVKFLRQIYPVCTSDEFTDTMMPQLLALAEEYEMKQVFVNCEGYIGNRLAPHIMNSTLKYNISGGGGIFISKLHTASESYVDMILLYLWMCELHGMKRHRSYLVELCMKEEIQVLEKSKFYKCVPPAARAEFLNLRCKKLEELLRNKGIDFAMK